MTTDDEKIVEEVLVEHELNPNLHLFENNSKFISGKELVQIIRNTIQKKEQAQAKKEQEFLADLEVEICLEFELNADLVKKVINRSAKKAGMGEIK